MIEQSCRRRTVRKVLLCHRRNDIVAQIRLRYVQRYVYFARIRDTLRFVYVNDDLVVKVVFVPVCPYVEVDGLPDA